MDSKETCVSTASERADPGMKLEPGRTNCKLQSSSQWLNQIKHTFCHLKAKLKYRRLVVISQYWLWMWLIPILTQIPVNEVSFLENLITWGRTLASWYVDNLDSSSTVLQKMYTTVSMFSIPGKNYNDAGNNISRLGETSFYCRFVAVLTPWRRQPVVRMQIFFQAWYLYNWVI